MKKKTDRSPVRFSRQRDEVGREPASFTAETAENKKRKKNTEKKKGDGGGKVYGEKRRRIGRALRGPELRCSDGGGAALEVGWRRLKGN